MRFAVFTIAMVACVSVVSVSAQSNVDPARQWAWSEIGWTNWGGAGDGADAVAVGATVLSGYIWSEAGGWINLGTGSPDNGVAYANVDGLDFCVNLDPETGTLSGFAWGENTGWINFATDLLGDQSATFDFCENRFRGYAWGESIGWFNLNDATHHIALGPVCEVGDVMCDEIIALPDFATFESFLEGLGVSISCPIFDHDFDGDVDLSDFAIIQAGFTG